MVRKSPQNGRLGGPAARAGDAHGNAPPTSSGAPPPIDPSPRSSDPATNGAARNGTAPPELPGERRGAATTRLLSLGAIASGMLRDFNNVMCAVMGFAQLLHQELAQQRPMSSPVAGYVRQILRAGRYGRSMSERLMGYAEGHVPAEAGEEGGGPATVDLRGIVDQAVDLVQHLIGGHIRFHLTQGHEPLRVEAEPYELEYAIIALLLGARDAMPAGGHLRLETSLVESPEDAELADGGRWARITMIDTGIPPAENADGLALVRVLVDSYGGTLRIHPAGSEGNRFEVHLPIH